jgi:hypothetical protein
LTNSQTPDPSNPVTNPQEPQSWKKQKVLTNTDMPQSGKRQP